MFPLVDVPCHLWGGHPLCPVCGGKGWLTDSETGLPTFCRRLFITSRVRLVPIPEAVARPPLPSRQPAATVAPVLPHGGGRPTRQSEATEGNPVVRPWWRRVFRKRDVLVTRPVCLTGETP
jgi:hypothetical protein